jgi:hypothetical protein
MQGLYQHTGQCNTQTHIHALSRIRTCDLNVQVVIDSTCLKLLGYWDRLYLYCPNTPSWRDAQVKHRDNFTFTHNYWDVILNYMYVVTFMVFRHRGSLTFIICIMNRKEWKTYLIFSIVKTMLNIISRNNVIVWWKWKDVQTFQMHSLCFHMHYWP